MRCLNDWQNTHTFATSMDTLFIIKFLSILMSRVRLPSPVPMEPEHKPSREHQRQLNDAMREVVKKEVLKLLHAGIIYPVQDSEWVSPVQIVPKKGGMMVVRNERNKLIPQRTVTGWRMCIDYRMLNKATRKDHCDTLGVCTVEQYLFCASCA